MSVVYSLIRKDLVIEFRSRQAFVTTAFFGLLVLVVGNFALAEAGDQFPLFAPGILWISFLFSGLLFLNHILHQEKEESTLSGLLISPATPGQIFLGKMLSAVIFLVALEALIIPVFHILFNFQFSMNSLWLFLVMVLAAIGYCAIGVLFSTMAMGLKHREMILSVMLFPILIPLLIMSVKCSIILLNQQSMEHFFSWLKLLAAFDVIFSVLSYWSYFWIVEEI
jgi:heme exporter protein B